MPAIVIALVVTAAVFVIGSYFFGGTDNVPTTTGDSCYSSTRTQPSDTHHRPPATLSDKLAGVEDAKKLRKEARRRGGEMSEAYSRAKIAQKKGYRGAAHEHRQRGDAHKSSMEDLDKRAAKIIFRENNKVSS